MHALSVLIFFFWFELYHGMKFFGGVAQQSLEVTDKAVNISLSSSLVDDVFVIVVAKTSA